MSLAPMYYRSAEIIILVFDVTREESFKSLGKWMEALQSNQRGGSFIVLAGNKIDMQERVIGRDEINAFCSQFTELKYFECSAFTGQGVDELFNYVIHRRMSIMTVVKKAEIIHDPTDKSCC